jgi:hypothetical protein
MHVEPWTVMHADWQLYFFLVAAKLQQKNLNTELGSADSLQFFLKLSTRAGWGVWKKWIQISWKDEGSKGCHVEVFSLIFGVGFSVKNYALFFLIAVAQRRVFLFRAAHLATTHPEIYIFSFGVFWWQQTFSVLCFVAVFGSGIRDG